MTIKEMAALAGVSRGTLDRVIHGRGGVRAEVVERVNRIIEESGYTPNKAGRALAMNKKVTRIGYLLPSIGNPFFEKLEHGIVEAVKEHSGFGVSVTVKHVKGYDPLVHVNAIRELVEGGCTYLALCTVDVPYVRNYIKELMDSGIKVITVNSPLSCDFPLSYFGSDYYSAGQTSAGVFAMLSPLDVKCLIVTGSLSQRGHNERIKGFEDGLGNHGILYRRIAVVESLDSDEISYERTLKQLRKHPEINCIFIVAAGVEGCLRAVKEEKAKEKGVYVMSFDDIDATKELVKEGAIEYTICQEPFRQGYRSLSDLIQYIIDNEVGINDYITNNIIKIKENID